jgi:phosphorylcholine metabolism protein LicD
MFEKYDIPYWLNGGTALGAVRHGGLIPWDDDLDIAVMLDDRKKILALEPKLNKCGYSIIRFFFGFKIFYTKIKPEHGRNYSFPNLDIFLWKYYPKEEVFSHAYKKPKEIWPKDVLYPDEIFPLRRYKFGPLQVLGASKYENALSRFYGKNWNKIAYRDYDHKEEEQVEKVVITLTNKDRKPAMPSVLKHRTCI